MPIAAVILAGGKGERLGGVDKARIEIGGRRLLDRVREAIAGCDPILLAVGRAGAGAPGMHAILDLDADYGGPLAGVAAAVNKLGSNPPALLLTVAVDTPFFPADFIARAEAALGEGSAAFASYAGQLYPTNALWRFTAIADLPRRVLDGTAPHSLARLGESLGARAVDYAQWLPDDPFANVNTPADLAALEARSAAKIQR